MKTLSTTVKVIIVLVLVALLSIGCQPIQKPVVAQTPYYTMTPCGSTGAVYTPVTPAACCATSCCTPTCGTNHIGSVSKGHYQVGSYPVYKYYNAPTMPTYGTYYYKVSN